MQWCDTTDFGSGLVTCIVLFLGHLTKDKIEQHKEEVKRLGGEASAVNHLMSGASDHLVDMVVPKGKRWDNIRQLAEEVADKAWDIGHGDMHHNFEDVDEVIKEMDNLILEIDRVLLGRKIPSWGKW